MLAWNRGKVSEVVLGIKDGVEGVFGTWNGSWRMAMWGGAKEEGCLVEWL